MNLNIDVIALNTYYKSLTNKLYPDLQAFRNISAIVKASEANIGIVFDSDGSRGIILDEAGNIVDLEDLFMLIISNEDSILKAKTNPLITSNSVSKILDDYSENLGYKLKRIQNLLEIYQEHCEGTCPLVQLTLLSFISQLWTF